MVNRLVLKQTIIKRFVNVEESDDDYESYGQSDDDIQVIGSDSKSLDWDKNNRTDSNVNLNTTNKQFENLKVFVTNYGGKVERAVGSGPNDNPFVQIQQLNELMNCQSLCQLECLLTPNKSNLSDKTQKKGNKNGKKKKNKKNNEKTTKEELTIEIEWNSQIETKPEERLENHKREETTADQKNSRRMDKCSQQKDSKQERDKYFDRILYLDGIKEKKNNSTESSRFYKCIICDISLVGLQLALDHSLCEQHSKVCLKIIYYLEIEIYNKI